MAKFANTIFSCQLILALKVTCQLYWHQLSRRTIKLLNGDKPQVPVLTPPLPANIINQRKDSPMVTSEELCVSKKLLRWCHAFGSQSIILMRSLLRAFLSISVSISFLLKYLDKNPLTGSVWLAHNTHLHRKRTSWLFRKTDIWSLYTEIHSL